MIPVVGYGSFILDIYYMEGAYHGCDGGGSVFNLLCNLSSLGLDAFAMGTGGQDAASQISINGLCKQGVTADAAYLKKGIKTRRLHVDIHKKEYSPTGQYDFFFTKKCFQCGEVAWPSLDVPTEFPRQVLGEKRGFVVFDLFINTRKAGIAEKARNIGFRACADLGHPGPLVYFTRGQISRLLSVLDILQLNHRVAKFLLTKFGVSDFSEIAKQISCHLVIVTRGADGADIYYRDKTGGISLFSCKPQPVSGVVDTSGAGDAFLSGVIKAYYSYYDDAVLPHRFFEDAFEAGFAMSKKAILNLGARGHLKNNELVRMDFSKENPVICKFCGV